MADIMRHVGIPAVAMPAGFMELVPVVFYPPCNNWDAYVLGWGLGATPTHLGEFFLSTEATCVPGGKGYNTPGYNNTQFDSLWYKFLAAPTRIEAETLFKELDTIVQEDSPYLPFLRNTMTEFYQGMEFPANY